MRKFLFPLLMLSFGLNLGLLYSQFGGQSPDRWERPRPPSREEGRHGPRGEDPDPERGIRHRTRYLADRLDLDADQRARMGNVLEQTVPRIVEGRHAMMEARRTLHETLARSPVDKDEFRRRVAELNRAQAQVDSLVAEAMLAEASVLTAEQRERYLELTPFGTWGGSHR